MNVNSRSLAIDFSRTKLLTPESVVGKTGPDGQVVPMPPEEKAAFSAELRQAQAASLESAATRMQEQKLTHTAGYAWIQGLLQSIRG